MILYKCQAPIWNHMMAAHAADVIAVSQRNVASQSPVGVRIRRRVAQSVDRHLGPVPQSPRDVITESPLLVESGVSPLRVVHAVTTVARLSDLVPGH